jgi:hypothetical protein
MPDVTSTLFGVRVSLATAVVAGAAAASQPVPFEAAMWGGVKLVHLLFGSIGAALTLSVVQGWTWARVLTTLVTGLASAAFGTPYAVHYLAPPAALATVGENAYAAIFGAVGVYLIPGLHNAAKAFAGNPWGFVDWWRGKGAPPQPPPPGGHP